MDDDDDDDTPMPSIVKDQMEDVIIISDSETEDDDTENTPMPSPQSDWGGIIDDLEVTPPTMLYLSPQVNIKVNITHKKIKIKK